MIGVISDTHSKLRPEAIEELSDCSVIIHAGDIGNQSVIDELKLIAPLFVVRGNIDKQHWASALPEEEVVTYDGKYIYVIHNINEMSHDPVSSGYDVVISGHTHAPLIVEKNKILYVNPGSAGPRRFSLPVTIGKIRLVDNKFVGEIIELNA